MKTYSVLASGLLLCLGMLSSSCNNADTAKTAAEGQQNATFDLVQARSEIEEANRNFMELVAKGDYT